MKKKTMVTIGTNTAITEIPKPKIIVTSKIIPQEWQQGRIFGRNNKFYLLYKQFCKLLVMNVFMI